MLPALASPSSQPSQLRLPVLANLSSRLVIRLGTSLRKRFRSSTNRSLAWWQIIWLMMRSPGRH
eukprot:780709-Alexandrium_andersonii.AAC.1